MPELPDAFPSMGAEFRKPYMEFEYDGQMYRLENLRGGHNGSGATAACRASPPTFDPEKGRWVVTVKNNLIDINLADHPHVAPLFATSNQFLSQAHIYSNPRRSYESVGYLLSHTTSPNEPAQFPIDCVFYMHIRISVPGKPSLINVKPFELTTKNLEQWPPPVGTIYEHEDEIELFPEWIPFIHNFMSPVVRIRPGDQTILTRVFDLPEGSDSSGGSLRSLWNRIT